MPRPIQASMTVRWIYIVVALVVIVGLGYWLFATYNTDPASTVDAPGVETNTPAPPN